MKITAQYTKISQHQKDCLIIGAFEDANLSHTAKEIDSKANGLITQLIKQKSFQGKLGQILPLFNYANEYALVLLIGCGKEKSLTPMIYRKIIVGAMNAFKTYQLKTGVCYLTEVTLPHYSLAWKVRQITEASRDAFYRFDQFKSEKEPAASATNIIIALPEETDNNDKAIARALKEGQAISEGVALAKNLGNTPSNVCTPTYLATAAKELSQAYANVKVQVLDEDDMAKLGMGALLGVAKGSDEEAQLICIEYQGKQTKTSSTHHAHTGSAPAKKTGPIALIGKGITFDTGGNSLKPADSMVGMKYDMCGGATVIGTIKAAAELALPLHIVGIVPAAENMPGGTAYKPEDIVTSLSGQTIEVMNTDAEGRLILADALTYCERYHPEVVIDIATLTGAIVIALGFHASGVLSNNEPLSQALLAAGVESNDRAWPLPLWEEYQEQLRSPYADVSNVGGRPAGAITAACFLSRFAKKFAWAHLDVAGTAAMMFGTSERAATGRPIPLLMQFLINRAHDER